MRAPRGSYANVVSTLALLVAVGGGGAAVAAGIAANSVGSKQIKNGSVEKVDLKANAVRGKSVKDGSLTGADVKESSFDKVPRAALADRVTSADNVMSAVVAEDGTLATSQSRGALESQVVTTGTRLVKFEQDISGCTYAGSIQLPGDGGTSGPGFVTTVTSGNPAHTQVFVRTYSPAGVATNLPFSVLVVC